MNLTLNVLHVYQIDKSVTLFSTNGEQHVLKKYLFLTGESNSENSHHIGGVTLTEDAVEGWLNKCSLFSLIMKQVFHGAFQFYVSSILVSKLFIKSAFWKN